MLDKYGYMLEVLFIKEYGVGLVGYGYMGKTHTYGYKALSLYYPGLNFRPRLAGVCSTKADVIRSAMDDGYAFGTACFDELLSREDIDIIDICTPNSFHYEQVMAAIKAGKHIYCEKPLAISPEEAWEMAFALRESGLVGQIAMQYRFFPATLRAKQLIEQGHIGNLMSFRAAYLHSGSVDPDKPISWKFDREIGGGGVLFDLGSHVLNLMHYFLGEYSEVFAATRVLYPERPGKSGDIVGVTADDAAFLTLRMKCGAIGTVEVSKIATGTNDELSFEIYGDRGAMRFNLMDASFLEFFDNTEPEAPLGGMRGFKRIECVQRYEAATFPSVKSTPGWIRAHVHGIYCFLDCVHNERRASPSFDEGAYVQNIMDMAYKSAKTGRWIKLNEKGGECDA